MKKETRSIRISARIKPSLDKAVRQKLKKNSPNTSLSDLIEQLLNMFII